MSYPPPHNLRPPHRPPAQHRPPTYQQHPQRRLPPPQWTGVCETERIHRGLFSNYRSPDISPVFTLTDERTRR